MNDAVNNDDLDKNNSVEVESLPIDFGGLEMPDTIPDTTVNSIKVGRWAPLFIPQSSEGNVHFWVGLTSPQNKDVFFLAIYDANKRKFEYQDAWLTRSFGEELSITVDGYKLMAKAELEGSSVLEVNASYSYSGRTFNIPKQYTIEKN